MSEYEVVIGLEIHAELKTKSKMFCGCDASFGGEPNSKTDPVCLGLPGVLPVLNRKAIELAIRLAIALDSEIAPNSIFHRKNYFYPDMPKNYQISQYDLPLAIGGHLDIDVGGEPFRVGITRVHMEEDTGKSVHASESGRIHGAEYSLEDFNRAGVPLVEIVTEPDVRTAEQARIFMQELRSILQHLEVSDGKMEEGSLRCDANISLRPRGESEMGVKTEVKNMNSFRALSRALEYEIVRQTDLLESGGKVVQETRHWDADGNVTTPMRTKEYAFDYRYFPEPDLVPLEPSLEFLDEVRTALPELPQERRRRFQEDYSLPAYDVGLLTASKAMGDFFEETVRAGAPPKAASNWMMGELSAYMNAMNLEIEDIIVSPRQLAKMIELVETGVISGKIAKSVFEEMLRGGKDPDEIVKEQGITQISDSQELERLIAEVIKENPESVDDYRGGKEKALGFMVGQVMRKTGGRANPQLVNEMLKRSLEGE
ncbi:MAG: aspartyl/glutamyl-tRNA amidotransferase subunit B [Candidatus Solincola sediminis]|uniref:Aspartyl/glutamyl-tRNA(Asn/Gln) amidotransferase subunit B n=1 Tax=Candidatus Solincola sediminis TaxID=1797199 RepID=A0A1F2WH40_9ACTN|nr:MAG: aspartyl/glutamyl-tRNA amidotransferase subunit B [Candidatus Solincola sediminis]OFW60426.1 MAG: aspartyl/glutamyl-tRNA amidotransferase subunit B [Candidatus Solincola sediminis]